jgi:hypothetical protein
MKAAEKTLSQARATLSSLERARADGMARATAIASDRRKIGYLAHTTGGAARKQLDDLNREGALLAGELESLGAAVEEAGARLTTAEQGVARAVARATALKARDEILPRLRQAGVKVSTALDAFGDGLAAFLGAADELGRTVGGTSRAVAEANLKRAIDAKLFVVARMNSSPLPMAANKIPTVADLTQRLCENVSGYIAEMLAGGPDPVDPVDGDAETEEAA